MHSIISFARLQENLLRNHCAQRPFCKSLLLSLSYTSALTSVVEASGSVYKVTSRPCHCCNAVHGFQGHFSVKCVHNFKCNLSTEGFFSSKSSKSQSSCCQTWNNCLTLPQHQFEVPTNLNRSSKTCNHNISA